MRAPQPYVYRALVDAGMVAKWRALVGMSSQAGRTDTYHGHFVQG